MKLLRHRGPADHLGALDHAYAQARHREIGRTGEAVMASADDDDVGLGHGAFRLPDRGVDPEARDADPDPRSPILASPRNDPRIRQLPSLRITRAFACREQAPCAPYARHSGARRSFQPEFSCSSHRCNPPPRSQPSKPRNRLVLVGLHRCDLRQRAAAVLGAAVVHQDGAAAARRLAGGVVGGDGVLPVAAARRLCLCAFSDAAPQPHRFRWWSIWCCSAVAHR